MTTLSILGIIIAAVVCFILGFLFHGPFLGRLWMKLANIHPTGNEKLSDMYGKMAWNFVANIITAAAISVLINILSHSTAVALSGISAGIVAAILIWIPVTASASIEVIWMGRKMPLFLFEAAASLICYIAMGIVLVLI